MLIPIRHENMSARRWPVITLGFIIINVVCFLLTNSTIERQGTDLARTEVNLFSLAASHPELKIPADVDQVVTKFRDGNPELWKQLAAKTFEDVERPEPNTFGDQLLDSVNPLQAKMDSLAKDFQQLESESITENYAFVPAHPKALSYITANFLHGGWLHLIGNMWFLWLAGFVLEDAWGRALYSVIYFIAGAAALQIHAWANAGSLIPTLGASGAVAALMGAFLVRFPKMKIEMMWLFRFRAYRFKAPAYTLLPLWVLMEVLYGSVFGASSGVAHWAHVGGFVFGIAAATALRYSGLEQKANQQIEEQIGYQADPEISQAGELLSSGQFDQAAAILNQYIASHPDSLDACNLLPQVYWRKGDMVSYQDAISKLCALHIKSRHNEAAIQDYDDFLNSGGKHLPASTWYDVCRLIENQQSYDRALAEYERLASTFPNDRLAIMAHLGAGRIYMKLNRPQDALRQLDAAQASKVPHLDLEINITAGIREAKAALTAPAAAPAHA